MSWNRRRGAGLLAGVTAGLLGCILPALAAGPAPAGEGADAQADAAVARGIGFLARQQGADGAFSGGAPPAQQTALTLLAFFSAGHTPGAGKYGLTVQNAIDSLLSQAPDDGYFGRADKSRLAGQAAVTMALAEALGAAPDPGQRVRLRRALEQAAGFLVKTQAAGKDLPRARGWGADPGSADGEAAVTAACALALRAAAEAGVAAPKEAFPRAAAYLLSCYRADRRAFAPQPGREPTPAATGSAILCLSLLEAGGQKEAAAAGKYLAETRAGDAAPDPYYALFVSARAAPFADAGPPVWKAAREALLPRQAEDGGWPASRSPEQPGRVYSTTLAVLALSSPVPLTPGYTK